MAIQLPPNSTGTVVDTVTVGAADREIVVLGDPATSANRATVTASNALKVDGSAVTQPVSGTVTANQGGTWTVQPGNTANTTPWLVTQTPATSGGLSDYHTVSAASTNAANIKASAGQIFGFNVFNNAAYPVFVKLFNKATAPIPGTDTPVFTIGVQAGVLATRSIENGVAFGTGIGIAIVKGIADADATAVAASDCVVDLQYK